MLQNIAIGALSALAIFLVIRLFFVKKQLGVDKSEQENINRTTSEFKKKAEEQIDVLQGQLDILLKNKQDLEREILNSQNTLQQVKDDCDTQIRNFKIKMQNDISEAANKGQKHLIEIQNDYEKREKDYIQQHYQRVVVLDEEIVKKQDELKNLTAYQQNLIEAFKRQEEIKTKEDFYRIVLSETIESDIKKLKQVAETLTDGTILYKLIYKSFYEKPFGELIGRVAVDKSCGIYKITNKENGKVYIGQTRQSFKERWRTHLKRGLKAEPGTANKLYAAMWEEGPEHFTWEILEQCEPNLLNQKEKKYIEIYKADTWGYNTQSGNNT